MSEGRGRGQATPWPLGGRRETAWHWPVSWNRFVQQIQTSLKDWALADVAPGRLVPWLPVAFGAGIVFYFAAEREPSGWAAGALALAAVASTVLSRKRPVALPLALAFTAAAAGFAVATLRSAAISHPVLQSYATLKLSGWVEVREERERSDRVVVRVHRIDGTRAAETPERVRVAVRKGTAPPVGAFVEVQARLSPPLAPLRPGGYDFARDLYFQKIGLCDLGRQAATFAW
jgi:competence protein ComEC